MVYTLHELVEDCVQQRERHAISAKEQTQKTRSGTGAVLGMPLQINFQGWWGWAEGAPGGQIDQWGCGGNAAGNLGWRAGAGLVGLAHG